jgi:hypothetical protein
MRGRHIETCGVIKNKVPAKACSLANEPGPTLSHCNKERKFAAGFIFLLQNAESLQLSPAALPAEHHMAIVFTGDDGLG